MNDSTGATSIRGTWYGLVRTTGSTWLAVARWTRRSSFETFVRLYHTGTYLLMYGIQRFAWGSRRRLARRFYVSAL